ncbi:hypothetical protein D3C76_361870 [compost metagenome]
MQRLCEIGQRHLMRAARAFDSMTIDEFRTGPAFGRAQHQHGPQRPLRRRGLPGSSCIMLNISNFQNHRVQCLRQCLMHLQRVIAFDEVRIVAIAIQQGREFILTDSGQYGGIGDFVAIEVQDGQYRSVPRRVEKLVGVPTGCQCPCLGLAVTDHASDNQIRIVKRGTVGVGQAITQFATFMD